MSNMPERNPSTLVRKRRRKAPFPLRIASDVALFFMVVSIGLCYPFQATATVFLPQYNRSFVSLPGRFGGQFSDDENADPITTYLTLVPSQPYMCPDELLHIQPKPPFLADNNHNMTNTSTMNSNANAIDSNLMVTDNELYDSDDLFKDIEPLPSPDDGLPVAVLVERGMCTFYDKAVMASRYGPSVKYVIIYDNQIAPDLVPMSSEFETDMTLLFVSAATGRELTKIIRNSWVNQDQTKMNGDNENQKSNSTYFDYEVKIEIDGDSPYMEMSHPHLSMAAYFLVRIDGGNPFVFDSFWSGCARIS